MWIIKRAKIAGLENECGYFNGMWRVKHTVGCNRRVYVWCTHHKYSTPREYKNAGSCEWEKDVMTISLTTNCKRWWTLTLIRFSVSTHFVFGTKNLCRIMYTVRREARQMNPRRFPVASLAMHGCTVYVPPSSIIWSAILLRKVVWCQNIFFRPHRNFFPRVWEAKPRGKVVENWKLGLKMWSILKSYMKYKGSTWNDTIK